MSVFVLGPAIVLHQYTQRRYYQEHCADGCYCFPCLDKPVYFDHTLCTVYNDEGQQKNYKLEEVENLLNSYGYNKVGQVARLCDHRVIVDPDRMACCCCCCPYRDVGSTVYHINNANTPTTIVAPKNIYKYDHSVNLPCKMTVYSRENPLGTRAFCRMKITTPDGVAVRIGHLNTAPQIDEFKYGEIIRVCLPKEVRTVGEVSRIKVLYQEGHIAWCGYEKNNVPLMIDAEE